MKNSMNLLFILRILLRLFWIKILKRKYPELHHVLFQEINEDTLKLQFPKSYYLDIRSNTQRDKILRRFINDDSDTDPKKIKPIELANECYPIEVYPYSSTRVNWIIG